MTGVVVSIRIFSLFIVFVRLTLSAVVESVAFACAQRRGCTAPMCVCLSWREKENDKLMRGVYMPIGHSGFHLHCREQCWRRCGGERSTLFLLCVVVFPEGRWFAVHFFFFSTGRFVRPPRRILPITAIEPCPRGPSAHVAVQLSPKLLKRASAGTRQSMRHSRRRSDGKVVDVDEARTQRHSRRRSYRRGHRCRRRGACDKVVATHMIFISYDVNNVKY